MIVYMHFVSTDSPGNEYLDSKSRCPVSFGGGELRGLWEPTAIFYLPIYY